MSGTYYLNDSNTKWVIYDSDGNKQKKEFKTKIGRTIKRTVQYYEETCYGTVCAIKHKGKLIKVIDYALLDD